jgi:hypothetical protein
MTVTEAVRRADELLPGRAAPKGRIDPRWQAIIAVGEFVESEPEAVWRFVRRWGSHSNRDLRAAVATCLLEHLLEHHFDLVFPRMERLARASDRFVDTLQRCGRFGQSTLPMRAAKLDRLPERSKLTSRFSRRPKRPRLSA